MLELNDQELIVNYLKGDAEAFNFLIKKYLSLVYRFVYGLTKNSGSAEDIAQEAWLKVWQNLKKFKLDKNFKTWLLVIAKNTALDYFKKKKVIVFSDLEDEMGENKIITNVPDPSPLPDEIFDRQDLKRVTAKLLESLPVKQQVVLNLYYQEQLTFQEIGEVLEESIDTVKSRQRRALIKLKELLMKNAPKS